MTAFDTPDWVAGQTTVARDKVLYDSGAGYSAFPLDSGLIDVSRWSSVNVVLQTDNTGSFGVGRVLVTHSSQGDTVGLDYAGFGYGNESSLIDSGVLFTFPVPGDAVRAQVDHYDTAGSGRLIVVGSTRSVSRSVRPAATTGVPPTVVGGSIDVPASGVVVLGIVGPYENGLYFTSGMPTDCNFIPSGYAWDGTSFSAIPLAALAGGNLSDVVATVHCPGLVVLLEMGNNNTYNITGQQYLVQAF